MTTIVPYNPFRFTCRSGCIEYIYKGSVAKTEHTSEGGLSLLFAANLNHKDELTLLDTQGAGTQNTFSGFQMSFFDSFIDKRLVWNHYCEFNTTRSRHNGFRLRIINSNREFM